MTSQLHRTQDEHYCVVPKRNDCQLPTKYASKNRTGNPLQILVAMRDAMKVNYASIPSRGGGGTYGYLRGLFSNAVYGTVAPGIEFLTPPDPGPLVILTGYTNTNLVNINRDHSEACREHK